jgi:hypothetical protein
VTVSGRVKGVPSAVAHQGPVEGATLCGDRATAPIPDIPCEKIRGCSYRENHDLLKVHDAPTTVKFGIASS